jgi:methylated-DNA-[protein]-cysteine S-methyltransferase
MDTVTYSERKLQGRSYRIAATSIGVCSIDAGAEQATQRLERRFQAVREGESPILDKAWGQLEGFLEGDRKDFDLPLDLRLASPFGQQVMKAMLDIPYGEVTTYGAMASSLVSSPRAVGGAVGRNPLPIVVPCHRVVAADGTLGGYSGGLDVKRMLLAIEGHGSFSGGWEPSSKRW